MHPSLRSDWVSLTALNEGRKGERERGKESEDDVGLHFRDETTQKSLTRNQADRQASEGETERERERET